MNRLTVLKHEVVIAVSALGLFLVVLCDDIIFPSSTVHQHSISHKVIMRSANWLLPNSEIELFAGTSPTPTKDGVWSKGIELAFRRPLKLNESLVIKTNGNWFFLTLVAVNN